MLKIGLTGGIGCGKTTVSQLFQTFNVPVIDADTIAHQLVAVGQPALASIRQQFGAHFINPDGSLNRAQLREVIFTDAGQKQQLEALLHPLIHQTIQTELAALHTPYCIISIPLLFETQMTHWVDRILVIDCPVESQIERVLKRDNMPLANLLAIIASQVTRDFRTAHADDLLANTDSHDKLAEAVKKLHNLYISLSTRQDPHVCE